MFEKALRKKMRFTTNRGLCDVEALWDFSVEELDEIYGQLSTLVDIQKKSLLDKRDDDSDVALAINIVKHIALTKLAEAENATKAAANKAIKKRIMEKIADKKDEALSGKSVEELEEMLNEL